MRGGKGGRRSQGGTQGTHSFLVDHAAIELPPSSTKTILIFHPIPAVSDKHNDLLTTFAVDKVWQNGTKTCLRIIS